MGTHTSFSNCEKCGGESWLCEDTHYDSTEEHCLNDKCRFYYVNSGKLKYENPNSFDGVGFDTPEDWKDMLEHIGYKKCEKCGDVGMNDNEDSPYCQDCETEEEEVTNS